jgi:hypothetical protein
MEKRIAAHAGLAKIEKQLYNIPKAPSSNKIRTPNTVVVSKQAIQKDSLTTILGAPTSSSLPLRSRQAKRN